MGAGSLSTLFPGEIRLYASATTDPPIGWLKCDGSRVPRATYSRLFNVIGTTYDVDNTNSTSFQLPDLRGRAAIGQDPFGIRAHHASKIGATGGHVKHTLTNDQLPVHYHASGSLTIGSGGTHMHGIDDPGHTHEATVYRSGNFSKELHLKTYNGLSVWSQGKVKVHRSTTGITVNAAGDHAHTLAGSTGATGNGESFSLLNPYQTLDYIIYAG
ncbi:unnamed protein product [Rotaria sp. Silwood1]|nr:unnamed protein product [Rotaria sp. Silwood1]CAF1372072.1 unnamed protein product [Rotaria sp. Silwood1]CAF3516366.1 unnamed protein product [Rotaria sp. Silwood1]CAF3575416.1 unnamed protein product [Rotaria sp. Silwood1]CAF4803138.1 unnamed protein product [Rotaria sp. Silwood1]